MDIGTHYRYEDGQRLPFLLCRLRNDNVVLSSAAVGGGLGPRDWIINAQVPIDYSRNDLAAHIDELRLLAGLPATTGVGMLTGAHVDGAITAHEDGVDAVSTVGVSGPEWAAVPAPLRVGTKPGTINVIACLPVALSPGALVNAVMTATEAKTQAMVEAGLEGSGTATDAVCIVASTKGAEEPFAGPRSRWGNRIALAVHATVRDGIVQARRNAGS
jgi:adenosylcobinamide amidohydrolase